MLYNGRLFSFGGTSEAKFYNDLWVLSPASADTPQKPPRASANVQISAQSSSVSSSSPSTGGALEAPVPIPSKRTAYTTSTAVPSPKIVVTPSAPGKVVPRDVSGPKNQVIGTIESIFAEIQKEYLQLDQERAVFQQEKVAFAEERKANEDLFARQQKEVAALIEQHKEENGELLRKRQAQYDEKVGTPLFFFPFFPFFSYFFFLFIHFFFLSFFQTIDRGDSPETRVPQGAGGQVQADADGV